MKTETSLVSFSLPAHLPGVLAIAGFLALAMGSAACGGSPTEGANIDDPTVSEAPVVAPVAPIERVEEDDAAAPAPAELGPVQRGGTGGGGGASGAPGVHKPGLTGSGTRAD